MGRWVGVFFFFGGGGAKIGGMCGKSGVLRGRVGEGGEWRRRERCRCLSLRKSDVCF